jgi:histidinol-phosphate aminotransferase
VRLRRTVADLPTYRPGRNPADIARELGIPEAVKLASNETGYPPLPSVVEAVCRAATDLNRYPDAGALQLTTTVAARFGVEPPQVALGAGSVGLGQALVLATAGPGDEVLYAWRSFEAYPLLVTIAGARSRQVPLAGQVHDLDAMAAAITDDTRLVFVCNPNNPTGTTVGTAALERFLDAVPADVLVVIDEAYREFVTGSDVPDGLALARGRDNVAVLRTLSKAYGLAGLRVGYCLASPPVAEAVRKVQVPFAVSSVAQAAGVAALRAEHELADRLAEIVAERGRVVAALRALGVDVPDSEANFCWLPLGEQSLSFARQCEQHGVIVRAFAGDGVRVSTGTPAENDRFLSAAGEILG